MTDVGQVCVLVRVRGLADTGLAYSLSQPTRLRTLHIYNILTGLDTVVSSPMESDYRPAFSQDSRFIYFVSDRHDLPVYADRETNAVTIKSGGIYVAALSPNDVPPFAPFAKDSEGVAAVFPVPKLPQHGARHPSGTAQADGPASQPVPPLTQTRQRQLGVAVHDYWASFVRTGDPNGGAHRFGHVTPTTRS